MKTRTQLYFAYGANTHLESMAARCPKARPVCSAILSDSRLVFRGVADVERCDGSEVHGALWEITPECEASLDRFEGFPRFYVKQYFRVTLGGRKRSVMMYVMREQDGQSPPGLYYLEVLEQGYKQFGLPLLQLQEAIKRSTAKVAQLTLWKAPPGAKGRDDRSNWKREHITRKGGAR